jgi:hypothetical protein
MKRHLNGILISKSANKNGCVKNNLSFLEQMLNEINDITVAVVLIKIF